MTLQPDAELAEFADTIRRAFHGLAAEFSRPGEGTAWTWSQRGLWTIRAGAALTPEPVIAGPAGEWRIARADLAGARFTLLLLAAADALPAGVALPDGVALTPGNPAPPPSVTPVPVMLPLGGPRKGELQAVIGPGGGPAVVNLVTGGNFVAALDAGRMGVVVVKPMPDLSAGAPVPAMLHPAPPATVLEGDRFPALREVVPGRPSPRPSSRVPGANTGTRPGPGFVQPAAPSGFAPSRGGYPYGEAFADVDLPAAGMGPGAGYAPEVIRDDRVGCEPPVEVAGSDLPARDAGGAYMPLGTVNDTGHAEASYDPPPPPPVYYEPPAAADPPAYDPGPAPSCD